MAHRVLLTDEKRDGGNRCEELNEIYHMTHTRHENFLSNEIMISAVSKSKFT
jgi:hypothetical protein